MALSIEEIQNLSQLFLSKDDTNTQLAFEIMAPHGFIPELLSEIFVVYKLTKSEPLRQEAAKLLNEHGSANIKAAMARKLEFNTEKTIKKNIGKYVLTSGKELDGLKFAQALYNKYELGFAYLMKEASSKEKKEILETHKDGTSFKMHSKGLTSMPKEFFEFTDLEDIDISRNKLTSISAKFKVFKHLKKLNVSSNCLKKVHANLASLEHLEELNLKNNLVEEFPAVLGELKSLRHLDMRGMLNISGLVRGILVPDNFSNLKLNYLGLSSDPLNGNKHGYSKFPYLGELQSQGDDFLDLDPLAMAKKAFKDGSTFTVYYLLFHADTAYRKQVLEHFYDAATKTMNLSGIIIKCLPEELADFDIRILNMADCHYYYNFKLLEEPEEGLQVIGKLKNLEELYLGRNGLHKIPLSIFNCTKIRLLDLHKNLSIKSVPADIKNLQALEHLNLKDTNSREFIDFPDEIKTLKQLKTVKIDHVSFKSDEEVEAYKKRMADLFGTRVALSRYGLKEIERKA